jgi:predicted O-methyltransferase YrrM
LPAANYLVGLLGSIMPTRIAELGMGYSTIFLHRWRAVQEQKPEVWSMEHEPNWLAFMRVLCADQGIGMERVYERCAFQKRARSVEFDVILIDQGPTEQQRADDLRWVVPLLSKQGVLVFDDWHKGFPAMYKRALSRIGKWNIEVPESSRSGPGGKVLAVVRRRG